MIYIHVFQNQMLSWFLFFKTSFVLDTIQQFSKDISLSSIESYTRRVETSLGFHKATTRDILRVCKTNYVVKGDPITRSESKSTYPNHCDSGKKIMLQRFYNVQKKHYNTHGRLLFSPKPVFFRKKKTIKLHIFLAKASALINDVDIQSNNDDTVDNKSR